MSKTTSQQQPNTRGVFECDVCSPGLQHRGYKRHIQKRHEKFTVARGSRDSDIWSGTSSNGSQMAESKHEPPPISRSVAACPSKPRVFSGVYLSMLWLVPPSRREYPSHGTARPLSYPTTQSRFHQMMRFVRIGKCRAHSIEFPGVAQHL